MRSKGALAEQLKLLEMAREKGDNWLYDRRSHESSANESNKKSDTNPESKNKKAKK